MESITTPKIGIFDSGVGGLTVMYAIKSRIPAARIVYCSDNLNFPYGSKTEAEVKQFSFDAVTKLVNSEKIEILVVACNTASTVALPMLRKKLSIPVVGVVPAIKPASEISKSKIIGLLATPGTISRDYTQDLIRQFASGCTLIQVGSSPLVRLAESFIRGNVMDESLVANEITEFQNCGLEIDTIVLACTHFPLLIDVLKKNLPSVKNWIDSGDAVARRVESVLGIDENSGRAGSANSKSVACFTSNIDHDHELQEALLSQFGFSDIRIL